MDNASAKEKPSILLVDDYRPNLVALEAVLGHSEYELVTATSGAEALALMQVMDFALVLLDIQMPDMDGYEVARRIKASPRYAHVPIIFITAIYKEDPHVMRGYAAGAVDYFPKPFNPEVLKIKVGIYAELYKKNLILQRKEQDRRELEQKVLDLERTVVDGRKEGNRRSAELQTILESVPDAIYVGNQKGITRCNGTALTLFGFESREELDPSFEQLAKRIHMRYAETGEPIPPEDQPFSHALRGEQFISEITIRHVSSGEDMSIACAAAPVILDGEIIGAVVVNSEVSRAQKQYPIERHSAAITAH